MSDPEVVAQKPTAPRAFVDIAVLDDDVDFLSYIEDLLVDEGSYGVRCFSHADELEKACEERRPDILLLDMKMGPFRGEAVLDKLRGKYPDLCVIIVTGYPSLEDMRATFQRKAFDYLAKPFSLTQLRQTLDHAIETFRLGRPPQDRLRDQLGRRIKVLRVEREWSLKELAKHSGISVSQLSSIERGAHMPSMESLLLLCSALEQKPSELLASIEF